MTEPNTQRSEQRAPQRAARLVRPPSDERSPDKFWYDPKNKPPDMAYQWIATSVMGQEQKQHMVEMSRYHWTPVPASRHPEIMGSSGGDKPIIIGGQMLCERPQYLNDESRAEEEQRAKGQVNSQMVRLGQAPAGTMERNRPTMNRSHERVAIPDDE